MLTHDEQLRLIHLTGLMADGDQDTITGADWRFIDAVRAKADNAQPRPARPLDPLEQEGLSAEDLRALHRHTVPAAAEQQDGLTEEQKHQLTLTMAGPAPAEFLFAFTRCDDIDCVAVVARDFWDQQRCLSERSSAASAFPSGQGDPAGHPDYDRAQWWLFAATRRVLGGEVQESCHEQLVADRDEVIRRLTANGLTHEAELQAWLDTFDGA